MLPYLKKEVEKNIVNHGSYFENGLSRIEKLIKSDLSRDRKIQLLKTEYGIGSGTVTLALFDSGVYEHNSKGISYSFKDEGGEDNITFTWSQVLKLYEGKYLS